MAERPPITYLPYAQLLKLLGHVRIISGLPDDEAIVKLDTLIVDLKDGDELSDADEDNVWRESQFIESMNTLRERIQRLRIASNTPGQQLLWNSRGLLTCVDHLGTRVSAAIKDKYKSEIRLICIEAGEVAMQAEIAAHQALIRDFATQLIHNSSNLKTIVAGIDRSLDALKKINKLEVNIDELARNGKERAARYRSQKKCDEAEVAKAGGNNRKADKLRREAVALLSQDWSKIFPGEQPPMIDVGHNEGLWDQ